MLRFQAIAYLVAVTIRGAGWVACDHRVQSKGYARLAQLVQTRSIRTLVVKLTKANATILHC